MSVGVHECAHPRCRTQVPVDLLACRPHWNALPKDLRTDMWIAWQWLSSPVAGAAAVQRHDAAKTACVDWWAAH